MTIKTVKLSKKYQENILDFKKEQDTVIEIVQNTFHKFQNETNYNSMEYALDVLPEEYVYVPNDRILSEGRYIRYLDMRNPLEIKLRIGGFLISDNGYTISLKGPDKTFRVSKKTSLFFSQINETDRVRVAVNQYV